MVNVWKMQSKNFIYFIQKRFTINFKKLSNSKRTKSWTLTETLRIYGNYNINSLQKKFKTRRMDKAKNIIHNILANCRSRNLSLSLTSTVVSVDRAVHAALSITHEILWLGKTRSQAYNEIIRVNIVISMEEQEKLWGFDRRKITHQARMP